MKRSPMNRRSPRPARRGFNLVEMLVALTISAALLTATLVALDASFMAYQATTEVASTHTVGRLAMHRMLTLIRTGSEFGPFPTSPVDLEIESDFIEFMTPEGTVMELRWVADDEALYIVIDDEEYALLEGVVAQTNAPFTLRWADGSTLHSATIDLLLEPDDNLDTELDGDEAPRIHLVASAMPRGSAFE
jgi:prepilin-type N-terminal cleavage/methylation domain-containing protein